jgi:predicted ATPase/DNA-binding CsgD family transcriptional regulator
MTAPNLPLQPTPFIGRQDELAEITRLLADPACRLLTLVGPGGIGKTRLAVEAAKLQQNAFANGVYLVALQALGSPDYLVPAIAESLHFQFYPGGEPKQQLLDFLREKSLLLILDNFEHLLDGVEVVSEMVAYAPAVKILATSRERLNLVEEWALEVQGLPVPTSGADEGFDDYGAVQLFMQNARRVHVGFSVTNRQRPAVARICQLVGGMPLGIELAAAWVRALSCEEIAAEIERSLDILVTSARNIPARHRTMRAALEHSWNLLTSQERDVFKKLSVFRGGFRKEAAQAVAGASLQTLSALVDKSLLRVNADGRYDVHELLRQYGEEQLDLLSEVRDRTHDRYCEYYAEFLQERRDDLKGRRQRAALDEIEGDFENVRTAWLAALQRKNYATLDRAAESLFLFCEMRSRFQEGEELFWAAQEQLDTEGDHQPPLWARILVYSLWLFALYRLNFKKSEDIKTRLDEYVVTAREQGDTAQIALCQWVLGALGRVTGNYVGAPARLEQSLALYTELGDRFYMARAADWLGSVLYAIGQLDDYIELSRQSLDWRRAIGDQFGAAASIWNLALATLGFGHYNQARSYIQEMGRLYLEMGSRGWAARMRALLAWIAFQQGDFQEAQAFSEEVLATVADTGTGTAGGEQIALAVLGLLATVEEDYARSWRMCERAGLELGAPRPDEVFAIAACGLEDYSMARQCFGGALSWNFTVHVRTGMANLLSVAAILLAREGQEEQAVEVLGLAFHHPASAKRWMNEWPLLARLRTGLESRLGTDVYVAAWERGKANDLDMVVTDLLLGFGATTQHTDSMAVTQSSLVDPLTERELEVLRLMAAGMSNREVAETLILSVGTVKWYGSQICSKLHAQNRVQAIARARELHILL